jgi:hypothetical protein
MLAHYSRSLRDDLNRTLVRTIFECGIVNVPHVAAQIRNRHRAENLTLEDAERLVLGCAQLYSAPIEFDRSGCSWQSRKPVAADNGGLLIDIVQYDFGNAA